MKIGSRTFRNVGGFSKDSSVDFIEIPLVGEAIFHYKNGTTEQTRCYNLDICERFVTQGKWEEVK